MAVPYKVRRLDLYSLDFHLGGTPGAYADLLRLLRKPAASSRIHEYRDTLVAMPRVESEENGFRFRALYGDRSLRPLILKLKSGDTREIRVGDGEAAVNVTHVLVDTRSRRAVVEYNKVGAKATAIADLLSSIVALATGNEDAVVTLSPVPGDDFGDAVLGLERIKRAEFRMTRPNPGWKDYAELATGILNEAETREVSVAVKPERGGSLRKTGGAVGFILKSSKASHPSISEAVIEGRRRGEATDTQVRLSSNVDKKRVRVAIDDGQVRSTALYSHMRDMLGDD